ncbi:MAG: Hsp20/alpha crystallin family protein [Gammaproteobacteria bacterium]|nr:Hsp20/alpha crystallin family protein [Gammaproteobacteria bacterium]
MSKSKNKSDPIPVKKEQSSPDIVPRSLLTPFEELEHWAEEMMPARWLRSRLGDWPSRSLFSAALETRMPKVDVIDRDNEVFIKAELPGINKDDIDVSMTDNRITIKATSKQEKKEEKGDYYHSEITQGSFSRSIPLPAVVNIDKAQAQLVDGVLELRLPKVEGAKRRNIKVK